MECVRQGTVSAANNLGSGIPENPALLPFLPELCERLLGQTMRLPSVETWWCGDQAALSHAEQPDPSPSGPSAVAMGAARGAALEQPAARAAGGQDQGGATPLRGAGDAAPVIRANQPRGSVVRRNVAPLVSRSAAAGRATAMLGGLARVTDDTSERRGVFVTEPNGQLAKDVCGWQRARLPPRITARGRAREEMGFVPAMSASIAMVPRVLSDLYWFGRYAERAEDLLRLVLATRTVAIETDLDVTHGRTLEVLLQAVTTSVPRIPVSSIQTSR